VNAAAVMGKKKKKKNHSNSNNNNTTTMQSKIKWMHVANKDNLMSKPFKGNSTKFMDT
jgi:hypothetical protein